MKVDFGLTWAKFLAIYGQVGAILGIVNSLMLIGIFYTTTIRPALSIPLWLYLAVMFVAVGILVSFVLTIGISGYYRFFNQQSALDKIDQKITKVMRHLGIKDEPT